MDNESFRSGFVTIIGRPNVGKSTLLNKLVGEKVAIMSSKPQTTRRAIKAILNKPGCQIIFIDTPGVHRPRHKLGKMMLRAVEAALGGVDVVLLMVEAYNKGVDEEDRRVIARLKESNVPAILVVNKIDAVAKEKILKVIDVYKGEYEFATVIPISALKGDGLEIIVDEIRKLLPEGPQYFPEEMITDQTERQMASEIIREKALQLLKHEVPHGIAVEITQMKQREDKEITDIDAVIYCDKESHKGIIIGNKGGMLKEIGTRSRENLEEFLRTKIFLQLWVKVKEDWKNDDRMLKNLENQ